VFSDMMTYQWEFLSLVIESRSRWTVQWRHGIYVSKSDYCVENSTTPDVMTKCIVYVFMCLQDSVMTAV